MANNRKRNNTSVEASSQTMHRQFDDRAKTHGVYDSLGVSGSPRQGYFPGVGNRRKNIIVDDGGSGGDGSGQNAPVGVDFPPSNIETADRAVLVWAKTVFGAMNKEMEGVRVTFATGDRWALTIGNNHLVDRDNNPILPMVVVSRNSIQYGSSVTRRGFSGPSRSTFSVSEEVNAGSPQGTTPARTYYDIETPVPFQITYTFDFWTRVRTQLNQIIATFWAALRNRQSLEVQVVCPETGWSYQLQFNDTMDFGENEDDFTAGQRIVRSAVSATLWGTMIDPAMARISKRRSIEQITLQGHATTNTLQRPRGSGSASPLTGTNRRPTLKQRTPTQSEAGFAEDYQEQDLHVVDSTNKGERIIKFF